MSESLGTIFGILVGSALGGAVIKVVTRGIYIAFVPQPKPKFWSWGWFFASVAIFVLLAYLGAMRQNNYLLTR